MSEVLWVAVVSGMIALVGSFGGILIANGHARKLAGEERVDRLQQDARAAVVDVLASGRTWNAAAGAFGLVLASRDSEQEAFRYLSNADSNQSVEDMGESGRQLRRMTTAALLLVGNETLRARLIELRTLHDSYARKVVDAIFAHHRNTGGAGEPRAAIAVVYERDVQAALEALERDATTLFSSDLTRKKTAR